MTEPPQPHMSPFPPSSGPVNLVTVYGFLIAFFFILVVVVAWYFWKQKKLYS
jgi:hypothetical protein